MLAAIPRAAESKQKLFTATDCFDCESEMTGKAWIRMHGIEANRLGIGVCEGCASGRSVLAENWMCGVSLERAPKLSCGSLARSSTKYRPRLAVSSYFGKR